MFGKTFAGERCFLHCAPGFKPAGKRVAVCETDLNWAPKHPLKCVPIQQTAQTVESAPQKLMKPYIKCPKDVVKVLPKGFDTVLVKIDKPVSNVDWYKYVDAIPGWGKRLEANLPLGNTEIVFRARSPHANVADMCRVNIKVLG